MRLAETQELEGVAAAWVRRHECVVAIVRPDNYLYGVARSTEGIVTLVHEAAAALGHPA